jgi:alkylation response protein AidB-like acyl-CoA dehydrogenase
MDFHFTPEEQAFRREVRSFFVENWPERHDVPPGRGTPEWVDAEIALQKKMGAKGWLAMAWPTEYGGQGASHVMQAIFGEESGYAKTPNQYVFGPKMIGPCLLVHGTEEQKRRFLPPIASAEERWCQGFSERVAGSDLAGLQTTADRDGDDYVINGEKVWTSNAGTADWIFFLARTDPNAPKHRGISYFVADMRSPGISLEPVPQINGNSLFRNTTFENVRVPASQMVGEENRGWYVAASTLDFERSGIDGAARTRRDLDELFEFARETPYNGGRLIDKPGVRYKLADLRIATEVNRWLCYRVVGMQSRGLIPNMEASIPKAFGADLCQRVTNAGVTIAGMYGQLHYGPKAPLQGQLPYQYLDAVSETIMAGSNEIQRNIIANRGLGLPRE